MAGRKSNPFAAKVRRLPYKALIRREGPWCTADGNEIEAMSKKIANGSEYQSYAGSRNDESGCRVICFDTPEKARLMQAWIEEAKIGERPLPQSPPGLAQLKFGSYRQDEEE
jgi:hypothetical protein